MTNSRFFRRVFDDGYSFNLFNLHPLTHFTSNEYCFSVDFKGKYLPFFINVKLTKRSIITDIIYSEPDSCKFYPFELREWCPAIYLPWTNYLHWLKYLRIALEIFVESNPKLLSK